ncbi:FAD-dependent oxidoreductase [Agrobacterium sp. NPDC090283]|uniref:FAD-dependent oxidoreductase n=1 Tax=Agrobacterium sp. NPDC090283 TaxID=3363920 RepID=UPI00383B41CA
MANEQYDLVVVGAGVAGMAAAIVAHNKGLRVVIVEKTAYVGGTTAFSGGVSWVPNSRQNRELGVEDSVERATQYLDNILGNLPEREARIEYLKRGPEAVDFLESVSHLKFFVRPSNSPDYFPDVSGAEKRGRALTPVNYDGRLLGEKFRDIRPPLPELCLFGTAMLDGPDLYHLLNARSSLRSAWHSLALVLRHARDRIFYRSYGRGTRLTGGNAVIGRLYKSILEREIPVLLNSPLVGLLKDGDRVRGVAIQTESGRLEIRAECGVVLATGGFPWGAKLREHNASEVPVGYSATSRDSTGDGISIAVENGAELLTSNSDAAFWTPVSIGKRRDGSLAHFPHLMADRSKPGLIAVNGNGKRFYNESENYHDFVRAMIGRSSGDNRPPFHLICDHTYITKYVFGMVAPLASARRRHIRSGYLINARSLDELASKIGVDAAALSGTLERYNRDAALGTDTEFGKGSSAYNKYLGDPSHKPNPCLAPIERAPFYAIRVYPGDIGTAYGLSVDLQSRVLDASGGPIDGLYACGNDRNSIMGGMYPSGGITVGPALTFAYLAALDAAGVKSARVGQPQSIAS